MKKYSPLVISALFLSFVAIEPALAAQVTDSITSVFQRILDLMTGTLGTVLACVAVAGTGISWMFFGVELRKAMSIIVGIVLVFGAAQIVAMFQGK